MRILSQVISGCQTGADEAGLQAAYDLGIKTGGWMPKGYRTLTGPRPDLAKRFGLRQHSSAAYNERTWDNVLEADATIRFASNFKSAGEKCTLNAIKAHSKPYLDFDIPFLFFGGEVVHAAEFIYDHKIVVLNIAGNSEQTSPNIYKYVYSFLTNVFQLIKK